MRTPARLLMASTLSVVLLASYSSAVEARGGARGGGFSRSSVAGSGSFSVPPQTQNMTVVRDAQSAGGVRQPRDAKQPQGASSAGGVGQPRGAASAGGVGGQTTGVMAGSIVAADIAANKNASTEKPVRDASAEDMAKYRAQFASDNPSTGDDDRWDGKRPVDPDYGVPVIPPAVVAAGVIAVRNNNAVDYVAGGSGDDYYTELPCTVESNLLANDSVYYQCSNGWYKRVMRGDDVVYVQVENPPSP